MQDICSDETVYGDNLPVSAPVNKALGRGVVGNPARHAFVKRWDAINWNDLKKEGNCRGLW